MLDYICRKCLKKESYEDELYHTQRAHTNCIRAFQKHPTQDIKETVPLSPTGLLLQKLTPKRQGVKANQTKRQKQIKSHLKWGEKEITPNRKEKRNPQK